MLPLQSSMFRIVLVRLDRAAAAKTEEARIRQYGEQCDVDD